MPNSPLKRPHFFSGKLLTAEDLSGEQQYVIEKFKRHNRSVHGFGIVSGLNVTERSGRIIVQPGLALDCDGNEVLVDTVQTIDVGKLCDWQTAYLSVSFVEIKTAETITESFQFDLVQENANQGHRHVRARWLACGQGHALTIAKLRKSAHGWRIDRGYRPPRLK